MALSIRLIQVGSSVCPGHGRLIAGEGRFLHQSRTYVSFPQILEVTMQKFPFGGNVLRDAARKGDLGIFNEVAQILKTNMDEQQVSQA